LELAFESAKASLEQWQISMVIEAAPGMTCFLANRSHSLKENRLLDATGGLSFDAFDTLPPAPRNLTVRN
jgi:hypothetical protein